MLKIYVESALGSKAIFKDGKIEDHLEDVESILSSIMNITDNVPHRYTKGFCTGLSGSIVIELSMVGENLDNIQKIINTERMLNNVRS